MPGQPRLPICSSFMALQPMTLSIEATWVAEPPTRNLDEARGCIPGCWHCAEAKGRLHKPAEHLCGGWFGLRAEALLAGMVHAEHARRRCSREASGTAEPWKAPAEG